MVKLSIIIPSRDEQFLIPTIDDIFAHATGEIEVIAVIDSDKWPAEWGIVTDRHPNLHTIHHGESKGMRAAINSGVSSAISRGAKYVAKSDGHCSFSQGFDEVLKADMDDDWVVIPRRGRLDPENWVATDTHKPDIDYHYLSFPDDPNDFGGPGLNGKPWLQRAVERRDKPEYDIDDEMSSQGSFWAMKADYFQRLELMDQTTYGPFWNEMQEILLKCWLSGGRGVVNKKCTYLHLHKGKKYGRGYHLPEAWLKQGRNAAMKWLYNEGWAKQTLPFKTLIERFWPVPGWPEDWEGQVYGDKGQSVLISGVDSNSNLPSGREPASTSSSLKIERAFYGVKKNAEQFDFTNGDPLDVTEKIQSFVANDSLDIVVNNSTLDVGNPFRGRKKTLRLTYSYDDGPPVTVERVEKEWLIVGQVRGDLEIEYVKPMSPEVRSFIETAPIVVAGKSFIPARTDTISVKPLQSPTALNDYLIRKFSISPQRLKAPMPIELPSFHRNDLAKLFAELGFQRGAEIGVAEGNYSEILLQANPACELLLVDPWHAYSDNPQNKSKEKHEFAYNETLRKTAAYGHVRMKMLTSMDAVSEVEQRVLDFCYIDANHSFDFVMQDLIEWSKRVRSGGIVSGDDFYRLDEARWGAGPVEAVQAYTHAHRIPVWYIFVGHKSVDYMWVNP